MPGLAFLSQEPTDMQQPADQIREEARTLHCQASEARALAGTFSEQNTVRDLENFAAALEHEAEALECHGGTSMAPLRQAK
jgi:hypothetical protein